ncbi:MAG TPA: hypothetical protein VFB51_02960 [Solirubrobacterales bacterium]|nr:hypothetical protein [Solirubrobacterales bacterium]
MEAFSARAVAESQPGAAAAREIEVAGLAHVATVSFLASRAIPSIGFWVALAGGVALARAGARRGLRWGYGASFAAMLQTVAIIGPARLTVPLTQAITAPLLGVLHARGAPVAWQMLVCGTLRMLQNGLTAAFAIVVLTGVDAYTEFYDRIARLVPLLPEGGTAAVIATVASLLAWAVFASVVQVLVYRRGLLSWPTGEDPLHVHPHDDVNDFPERGRYDPRAVVLSAAIAFGLLLASISWPVLAAVAAWLCIAALTARGDRSVVPAGAGLAAVLTFAVFLATMVGGLGIEEALARATRAGLLVLVATWLRAAAGAVGLREVSRRGLGRLRRVPSAREAALVMDDLGTGRQLWSAARSVLDALGSVERRPVPILDAVLGWVAAESRRFRPDAAEPPLRLRFRAVDAALVALAVAPGAALFA